MLTVLLLGGCGLSVATGAAKVGIDQLETDIKYGVGASPAASTPTPLPPALPPQPFFFGQSSYKFSPGSFGACPTAGVTAFAPDPATSGVTTLPKAGQYRWVSSGTYDLMIATIVAKIPTPMYQTRYVRNVKMTSDVTQGIPGEPQGIDFTYQTIEPRVGSGLTGTGSSVAYYQLDWQVRSSPLQTSASTGVSASPAPGTVAAGDTEGGLVLKEIDGLDSNGKQVGTVYQSAPQGGLLILPLPVQSAQAVSSAAPDVSGSNNSMQFNGTVGQRERVDLCGQPIEAWGLDGTLVNGAGTATVHFDIATEYGCIVAAFDYDGSWLGTTYNKEMTKMGQLQPDPLPAAWK